MLDSNQSVGVWDAVIEAYLDLLFREGIRGPEIANAEKAGLSESAFYEQLQSRENILTTLLEGRHAIWMRLFENEIEARYEATGGGLEIIADVLQKGFQDQKCFGFAFIDMVTESSAFSRDPFVIASEQKEHLIRFIEQLALKMGILYPKIAASAAVLVIERAIERTLMTGRLKEALEARLLFQCLQHA